MRCEIVILELKPGASEPKTKNAKTIIDGQRHITFLLVTQLLTVRTAKFLRCFIASKNAICSLVIDVAITQLNCLFSTQGYTLSPVCDIFNAIC